jgi:hypothetical protein
MDLGRPRVGGGKAHDCADLETLWCQEPVGNVGIHE